MTQPDLDQILDRGLARIREDPDLVRRLIDASATAAVSSEEYLRAAAGAVLMYGWDTPPAKVYIAMIDDRHSDPEGASPANPFSVAGDLAGVDDERGPAVLPLGQLLRLLNEAGYGSEVPDGV